MSPLRFSNHQDALPEKGKSSIIDALFLHTHYLIGKAVF
jgi:hypothetical protein